MSPLRPESKKRGPKLREEVHPQRANPPHFNCVKKDYSEIVESKMVVGGNKNRRDFDSKLPTHEFVIPSQNDSIDARVNHLTRLNDRYVKSISTGVSGRSLGGTRGSQSLNDAFDRSLRTNTTNDMAAEEEEHSTLLWR